MSREAGSSSGQSGTSHGGDGIPQKSSPVSLPSLSMWQLAPREACFFVLVVTRALALLGSSPPLPRPRPLPSSPSPIELYGRNLCHSSLSPAASQPPTPLATGWVSQDC
ncbi:hypothetical protein ACRRTK_020969 [Alexandromys fortis]